MAPSTRCRLIVTRKTTAIPHEINSKLRVASVPNERGSPDPCDVGRLPDQPPAGKCTLTPGQARTPQHIVGNPSGATPPSVPIDKFGDRREKIGQATSPTAHSAWGPI